MNFLQNIGADQVAMNHILLNFCIVRQPHFVLLLTLITEFEGNHHHFLCLSR